MIYEFKTKNGRNLKIDLNKWKIDGDSRHCTIIEINDGNLLLKNKYEDSFTLPEYLIKANELNVIDNTVELPKGLYEYFFLEKYRANSLSSFETLYQKYATLIFQNRSLVLNKAEYFLLKPSNLSTSYMYSGGINYSLGNLFESFESGNHIYYHEFCGYKKMYLVSMAASQLSGTIFKATFWSDESNEFLSFTNQVHVSKPQLPDNFDIAEGKALIEMLRWEEMKIDRQDIAIQELINEINDKSR